MMWVLTDSRIAVKKKQKATGDAEKSNHIHYCRKVSSEMLNVDSSVLHLQSLGIHRRTLDSGQKLDVGSIYSSFKTLSTITGAVERTVGQATTLNFSNTKGKRFIDSIAFLEITEPLNPIPREVFRFPNHEQGSTFTCIGCDETNAVCVLRCWNPEDLKTTNDFVPRHEGERAKQEAVTGKAEEKIEACVSCEAGEVIAAKIQVLKEMSVYEFGSQGMEGACGASSVRLYKA
ncbi:hypothetical protein Bca101_008963 [Brassica carinata]